ncbi:guanine deaminase-like [Bolinopsis microptera]|uniref:guanine deaminase-like n=1 Tax=Bolinopsis microptera TaxID=2820187 RepID=UPI00307B0346
MGDPSFMDKAVEVGLSGIRKGEGEPFAAVVVRNGEIVGQGTNRITINMDPTAHGEVEAIRDACKNLGTVYLTGCDLYTTCLPCPMCFGAAHWSDIRTVYYGADTADATQFGFGGQEEIYKEIKLDIEDGGGKIPFVQVARTTALKLFEEWRENEEKGQN